MASRSSKASSSSPADVVALRLPVPWTVGHVNAYLLRGDPLTLIDPGPRTSRTWDALETALAREGVAVEDIELVLLTHHHADHAGLAGTVRERSGCLVGAHELVAEFMADEPAARAAEIDYDTALLTLHGASEEVAATVREVSDAARECSGSVHVDVRLAAGDTITAGGRDLHVLLVPGHSPTDTLFSDDGIAFSGDHLLAAMRTVLLAERPPRGSADPRARRPLLPTYRASLARTAELGLRLALPGHGDAIPAPEPLMRQRLEEHVARGDRLCAAMPSAPFTAWELVAQQRGRRPLDSTDLPVSAAFIVLSDVLAQIDVLIERGRVRELPERDVLYERLPRP